MANNAGKVTVTYIGRKEPYVDRLYGTNLTFMPGQSRDLPADIAKKFLKHGDCFESADAPATAVKAAASVLPILLGSNVHTSSINIKGKEVPLGDVVSFAFLISELTTEEWNALEEADRNARIDDAIEFALNTDDTDAVLEQANQQQLKKDEELDNVQAIRDQIMVMDKNQLKDFAQINYQQKIVMQKSVENLRQDVIQLIDQFGVV